MDALATEPHFLDHIAPVWRILPGAGTLWVTPDLKPRAAALGLHDAQVGDAPLSSTPTLVASFGDAKKARRSLRPVVLMEHGAGQSYRGIESVTGSYVGSVDRDGVILALVPNQQGKARHDATHPSIPCAVIGSPHLDDLDDLSASNSDRRPCISFHWDCHLAPETRSALAEYAPHLSTFAAAFPGALGHAHPRLWPRVVGRYGNAGLRPVEHFHDVCRWASVYTVDNSSTLFTFAALDRPVVVLNSTRYRRDVHHGGRFWDWADVGVQVDHPADLVGAVRLALDDPPEVAARRRAVVEEVYPHRGDAARRAVDAIEEVLCSTPGPRR